MGWASSAFHSAGGVGGLGYLSRGGGGGGRSPYPRYQGGSEGAYGRLSNAEDYFSAIGDTTEAGTLGKRVSGLSAKNPGYTRGENDFLNPDGSVNWQALGGVSGQDAMQTAAHEYGRRIWPGHASKDFRAQMNAFRVRQAKEAEYAMRQGLTAEIDPSLKAAQDKSTELLNTSAISAGQEATMRSNIAAQIRTAQATRLARIGASMSMGRTSESPAAAALAQQAAEQGDQSLVSTLSDLGLQIPETNRNEARINADLATRIAAARAAFLGGSSKDMIGMQGDIASMIDALYSRDETMRMNRDAIDESGGSMGAGVAQGALSGASAGAALGPWGAAGGAVFGAGMGYLGASS